MVAVPKMRQRRVKWFMCAVFGGREGPQVYRTPLTLVRCERRRGQQGQALWFSTRAAHFQVVEK